MHCDFLLDEVLEFTSGVWDFARKSDLLMLVTIECLVPLEASDVSDIQLDKS